MTRRPISPRHPFGVVVSRHLEAKGLTKYRLAKIMGKDRDWVLKIASGSNGPRVSTILEFAKALEVPAWELFREMVEEMQSEASE